MIDDYLSRIPDVAHQDSCIFHGADGCALPRELRSDVCNNFECNGLLSIRETVLEEKPHKIDDRRVV